MTAAIPGVDPAQRIISDSHGRTAMKVMIVGDSITQGRDGDWTWRYRLWHWFRAQGVTVNFVGPYNGTADCNKPAPPPRPVVDGEERREDGPKITGGYAHGVDPEFHGHSQHCSLWGLQAYEAKQTIKEHVQEFTPDYLLVALGFNDIGWFRSDADGTLESMKTLVDNARSAKSDIKLALANVPQRSFLGGREDLPISIDKYNDLLENAIKKWSTDKSPISLVRFRENYSCGSKEGEPCPAGYDGLHPSALGEYEIASAFSQALVSFYKIGSSALVVPGDIPKRNTPIPTHVVAAETPLGITVTWDAVYGALGFELKFRRKGHSDWDQASVSTNRHDTTRTQDGEEWEYMVRTSNGDGMKSDWSAIVSAVAHPKLAAGPRDIVAHPTANGIDLSWKPPTGPYSDSVDLYEVITFGQDTPGLFIMVKGVRGTSVHIDGLSSGHTYAIAIVSWNKNGGGLPSGSGAVKVGIEAT